MTLKRIEKKKKILQVSLMPLQLPHIISLISDTLRCSPEKCRPLAQQVLEKTQGNPFFILLFLTTLAQEKYIQFNHIEGKWEWDLAQIQAMNITSNVVDMTTHRIQKLDATTQNILSLAAAIGNKFELGTLAVICGKTLSETAKTLWPAVTGSPFVCYFVLHLYILIDCFFIRFRWVNISIWRRERYSLR